MNVADMDAALRGNLRVRFRVGDLDPPDRVPGKQILGTETPWNQPPAGRRRWTSRARPSCC